MSKTQTSTLQVEDARLNDTVLAGAYWMKEVKKGETLRITDLEGNQAADTLFYNANDTTERYHANNTLRMQGNVYVELGTKIRSNDNNVMMKVVADSCGRHDTLGSACSCESNTSRYSPNVRYMHSCRDSFMQGILDWEDGMDKRDQVCNINFFMNVPVDPEGGSKFSDGISGAGKYVEMEAMMDTIVFVSNCPQLNNPCNGYDPTPIQMTIWKKDA